MRALLSCLLLAVGLITNPRDLIVRLANETKTSSVLYQPFGVIAQRVPRSPSCFISPTCGESLESCRELLEEYVR